MGHPTDPCGSCTGCGAVFEDLETFESHECVFTSTSGYTFCDADRKNNVWVEGADAEGVGGICLIDTMTKSQIVYVLQRDEQARADLKRVTTNVDLQELADTVARLDPEPEGDKLQTEINRNSESLILYTHFRGQPPFGQ